MPLVRIDIAKTTTAARVRAVSTAIYDAMVAIAGVPPHDYFQIISRHEPDELIYPPEGYLGIDYSPEIVFIQVTWTQNRTTEVKRAFYERIAETLHTTQNMRKQDIWISLVGVTREDWSFGNGEMQYVPRE
jgi:phenylpyruvate tautomerase PptA (4-oxalocrotonate tautomerase family)